MAEPPPAPRPMRSVEHLSMNRFFATLVLSSILAVPAAAQLTCTVTAAGESCGPNLAVTFTPIGGGNNRIDLLATGLHPNAITVLAFGDQPWNVPLGGGCLLLHNAIWSELHVSSSTGSFGWGRSWPVTVPGSYYMQFASVILDAQDNLVVRSTNCKIGACH
jgi:hypothetical protein